MQLGKIFKNKIFKKEIDNKCQLYKHQEIIIHQTSRWPIFEKNEYIRTSIIRANDRLLLAG
jgi:hypothetical protein